MRVIADIDEADIGGVKEGQRVTFTVDAYPDDIFEGAVTQVRQQATTESNVVTYEVVISAPNDQLKLKPGLTANVTIYTMEKNGVLAVPARALRFTPNEALLQEGETVEDVQSPFKVWTKEGDVFKAHKVETGISNGMLTEILSGVKAGTEVLTDFEIIGGKEESEGPATSNPFMPRPGGNRNRGGAPGAGGAQGGPGAGGAQGGPGAGGAGPGRQEENAVELRGILAGGFQIQPVRILKDIVLVSVHRGAGKGLIPHPGLVMDGANLCGLVHLPGTGEDQDQQKQPYDSFQLHYNLPPLMGSSSKWLPPPVSLDEAVLWTARTNR